MNKKALLLLLVNIGVLIGFGSLFLQRLNYEFIIYVAVIIFLVILIAVTNPKVEYSFASLLGLTVCFALHMAGGGIVIGGGKLYDFILIPFSSTLPIFRYDQLVHIWGVGASTLIMYCLLKKSLTIMIKDRISLSIVIVMSGLGVGAFNEVVEFIVQLNVPESGVGGYVNNALDLCSDLIGSMIGLLYINFQYYRDQKCSENGNSNGKSFRRDNTDMIINK